MENYKTRMEFEYNELKERFDKLQLIIFKYYSDTLEFNLNCPIGLLLEQKIIMESYLKVLEKRALIENVDLTKEETK